MITLKENNIDTITYLKLREAVCWKKLSNKQAEMALKGSLYTICAYDGDTPIGMGRIVGDGVVIDYIQDLIVIPEYQKSGIGRIIIEKLIEYVKCSKIDGTEIMLCLMCAKGRESFYEKFNFIARPTDNLGPGMIQYIK
jgi:GNAT superfamily N-acetyltransferase